MTILGSVASLFLKKASEEEEIRKLLKNKNVYIGGGLYLTAAIINIYLLCYFDYSTVLPLTALTYVWTMILSYFVLKERMTIRKVIGVIGIVAGAIILAE